MLNKDSEGNVADNSNRPGPVIRSYIPRTSSKRVPGAILNWAFTPQQKAGYACLDLAQFNYSIYCCHPLTEDSTVATTVLKRIFDQPPWNNNCFKSLNPVLTTTLTTTQSTWPTIHAVPNPPMRHPNIHFTYMQYGH